MLAWKIISHLRQLMNSGSDLARTFLKLSESDVAQVASLGVMLNQLHFLHRSPENYLKTHPVWKRNVFLIHFLTHLYRVHITGCNVNRWLDRSFELLNQKMHFRLHAETKTFQIRMQMYLLNIFSWGFFLSVCGLFPESMVCIFSRSPLMAGIAVGLGLQWIGVVFVQKILLGIGRSLDVA